MSVTNDKIITASAVQDMAAEIINHISGIQTTAAVVDSSGYITDLYTNSGVIIVAKLNLIGLELDADRITGNIDVSTSGGAIKAKVKMKYNSNLRTTSTITISTIDISNFYDILNVQTTGAKFNTDFETKTSAELYPSPYTNATFNTNVSTLLTDLKTMSNNLNVFFKSSGQVTAGVLTSTQGLTVTGGTTVEDMTAEDITATQNITCVDLTATGNIVASGTISGLGTSTDASGNFTAADITASGNITGVDVTSTGNMTASGGIINQVQITAIDLTLSTTSGANSGNSYIVGVDTSSGVVTITLPSDGARTDGRTYYIVDVDGSAASNNITIDGNGKNISGFGTSTNISTNYSSSTIVYSSTRDQWYII